MIVNFSVYPLRFFVRLDIIENSYLLHNEKEGKV